MRVGRGGAYFLISRSLGVEWGATVGIPLYFAQALGIAFYVSGFTEVLVGIGTLAALAVMTAFSANLVLRVQAVPEVIFRDGRDVDAVILVSSHGADLVFLGLRTPAAAETAEEYAEYYRRILESTRGLPPTALLMATEHVDFNRIFRSDEVFH